MDRPPKKMKLGYNISIKSGSGVELRRTRREPR